MNKIGLTDKQGIPFSADRFLSEPELAQEFMEVYEQIYYGGDLQWRELTREQLFQDAAYKLHCLERDLEHSEFLRIRDSLQ